jgi:hypothetical protein
VAAAGEAFCPKCGAVIGMADAAGPDDASANFAATMVGKKLPVTPPPRPASPRAPAPSRPAGPAPAAEAPQGRARRTVWLLLVVGFVALLLVGGLLVLLLLFGLG